MLKSLNNKLESMDISHNPGIGVEGYSALCEIVLENPKFTVFDTLHLEGNMIGDKTL